MVRKDKLRTYRTFKSKLKLEKYLYINTDFRGRMLMFSLRSGTNRLQIEKGRWTKQAESQRLCQQCDAKSIESERHMVTECVKYDAERSRLFEKILLLSKSKWNLNNINPYHQFIILMSGSGDEFEMEIFHLFQRFLVNSFKMRVDTECQ